ncbi:YjjG family noncanonical pyrimidine nucleotidase [Flavobacteriaceae bacterium F89]|uniref:YjjG family noncanonical pyrimidine nucleotidase n=1 Tax=Cerina litoralis TaxID=2874477 RepID=A0AAE3EY61_9FLAO|nr:YjjG family noncanonical pyrimidine nucleotidase [Cerina litoralis]MCG2461751.1 YjjG family noncanonical pyrimidine nucleotidase [Cerina litoralis]
MYKDQVSDVFFDLDHTLWDFDKNSGLTFEKLFSDYKMDIDLAGFLQAYAPINRDYWKLYREGNIKKEELRHQRLKSTFDFLKYPVSLDLIDKLADGYIDHLSSFDHLLPDALNILEYLKPRYRLHIITNGFQEIQDRKLNNSNIMGYFDQVVNSEMAGVKKPDPIIFRMALDRAGTVPQRSIMIGDDLEADILGAKAVGFNVLHFNQDQQARHDHCEIINDLYELKVYL